MKKTQEKQANPAGFVRGGAEIVKYLKTGSAYYAPSAASVLPWPRKAWAR